MNQGQTMDINDLRNHHVKKILIFLGGDDVPPYLQKAIKKAFSEFAEDVSNKDNNSGQKEYR